MYGTPVLYLTGLVVRGCVISSANRQLFLPVLESVVAKGVQPRETFAYYVRKTLAMMADIVRAPALCDAYNHVMQIWSLVSLYLSSHLETNGNNYAHDKADLYWLYDVLLFPVQYFSSTHVGVIQTAVDSLTPLMAAVHKSSGKVTMPLNEICEMLSSRLLKLVEEDSARLVVVPRAMEIFVTTVPYEEMRQR